MKLSKKDRIKLLSALAQLTEGYKYLMSDEVLIMHPEKTKHVYRSDQFQNPKTGEVVHGPMVKDIGSKLCYLDNGITALKNLLKEDEKIIYRSALGEPQKW